MIELQLPYVLDRVGLSMIELISLSMNGFETWIRTGIELFFA